MSAYFVPGAYDRKGGARFWKERLLRLGVPLLVVSFLLNPLLSYVTGARGSYWEQIGPACSGL
ncbi:hypothetical protein [Thermosporothrix hazakensis]|uniref:hypothetical protein n=1 Tax=Thermosporothrix hazakensis TaxID=644383 RepID=UPI003530BEA6